MDTGAGASLEQRQLLVAGRPRLLLAGEVHYFRLPRDGWGRRLDLLRDAGANAVASYVPWVVHERLDGTPDVDGTSRPELDLGGFLDAAADRGLWALVRPGPFTMGELRHEGVPSRLRSAYPHLVPPGWDGAPTPTSTLDYLHPDFLAEVGRWYAALGPVLAPRTVDRGGPVVGVQLDNEIGMLSWVANSPDLTDQVLAELDAWLVGRGRRDRYPREDWAVAVRSPGPTWAADLRVDLADFFRDRSARYVSVLRGFAEDAGFGRVPLFVNVHGTEADRVLSFGIGVSQLQRTWAGRPGLTAGSDHYVGTLGYERAADLHLAHVLLDATLGPDQPLASLELEAGTGDYGDTLAGLSDPSAVVLKTRLLLALGCRVFNWYLFAGGTNALDPAPDDRGTHRFGITGERHGAAAPVTPAGEPGPAYASTREAMTLAAEWEDAAARWRPEHDDLAMGFVADHWATEHTYPGDAVTSELVRDLTAYRGGGPGGQLPRMLLAAGFRYGAVDLQDRASGPWPRVLVLGCGSVLDPPVQRALVEHVEAGGRLLLHGDLPVRDARGATCRILADALGLDRGEPVLGGPHTFPSVVGVGPHAGLPEKRCDRIGALRPSRGEVLLRSAVGPEVAAVRVPLGSGQVSVLATDAVLGVGFLVRELAALGARARLRHEVDAPGLIALTTVLPDGARHLHLINTEGYDLHVRLWWDGHPLLHGETVPLAPRTGRIVPLT